MTGHSKASSLFFCACSFQSEKPASNPLQPKGGMQMSQLKKISTQKETVGYECEFVDPPPPAFQTECLICRLVLREPYHTDCCGTSFCQTCIQQVQDNESPCPNCRTKKFKASQNKGLKRSTHFPSPPPSSPLSLLGDTISC